MLYISIGIRYGHVKSVYKEEFWLTAAYENVDCGDGICTVSQNSGLKPSFHKHSQTAVCLDRSIDSTVV
jgi:hypothetical protein